MNSNFAIAHAAQGQPDRRERVGLGDAGEIGAETLAQRLDEHGEERQQQEEDEERERGRDQDGADQRAVRRDRTDLIHTDRGKHQNILRISPGARAPSAAVG